MHINLGQNVLFNNTFSLIKMEIKIVGLSKLKLTDEDLLFLLEIKKKIKIHIKEHIICSTLKAKYT